LKVVADSSPIISRARAGKLHLIKSVYSKIIILPAVYKEIVIDAESKAMISMVIGKRTKENTEELIRDFASRVNGGRQPLPFTTDDYPCYKDALLSVYGKWVVLERTGKRGRPRNPFRTIDIQYATLCSAESGIQE